MSSADDTGTACRSAEPIHCLVNALEDVLSLPLDVRRIGTKSWSAARQDITRHIVDSAGSVLNREKHATLIRLIAVLGSTRSTDTEAAIHHLVEETAEILFLPRRERSEYRAHSDIAPPYRIGKLLLEYALFSRHLDRLMAELNKNFCASKCPDPPVGCCHLLGYDLGLVPTKMLEIQAIEASLGGWRLPKHPDLRKCRYHTDTGCALRLFKTPACIGAMCVDVEDALDRRFPKENLQRFRTAMTVFRNSDIDREAVFNAMATLIDAGQQLLDATPRPTSPAPFPLT